MHESFSTLFDFLPIGAYRTSADGRQLRANRALAALNGFETEATTTGWVLSVQLGREGVREWRTHVARLDADGVPHPAPAIASPCGRAGDPAIRECKGMP